MRSSRTSLRFNGHFQGKPVIFYMYVYCSLSFFSLFFLMFVYVFYGLLPEIKD